MLTTASYGGLKVEIRDGKVCQGREVTSTFMKYSTLSVAKRPIGEVLLCEVVSLS